MYLKSLSCILVLLCFVPESLAQYDQWKHSGSMYIITTPEGAYLPDNAVENDFPILIRLTQHTFDFSQASPHGDDIRFSIAGKPLAYQIERWDTSTRDADIWVRIPTIRGNEHQEVRMHWGNQQAQSESNGESVFRVSDGFAGVWHLGANLEDATTNNLDGFDRPDKPTKPKTGIVGNARQFGVDNLLVIRPPGAGTDRRVHCMPSGNADRTMSAWVNATSFEGRNWASASIGGWGEPIRGVKPNMGLSYMTMTGLGQPRFHLYGFDPRCATMLPLNQWQHIALVVSDDMVRFYIDGVLNETIDNNQATVTRLGTLNTPASTVVDLGDHGNGRGPFNGILDEVRFESAARSQDWLTLTYENQKPLQTLVGPLVPAGEEFALSHSKLNIEEGDSITLHATAGGARKVFWVLKDKDKEQVLAVDQYNYIFNAGRVNGTETVTLEFRALFANGIKAKTIQTIISERIPDPIFNLNTPKVWNGRDELIISPTIRNIDELDSSSDSDINYSWSVSGMATISELKPGRLILKRAQNSGVLTVTLSLDNGGFPVSQSKSFVVSESKHDEWLERSIREKETPVDHQFIARDDNNHGTLHCRGTLTEPADAVFLKLYIDDRLIDTQRQSLLDNNEYALSTSLRSGLFLYRTEFGTSQDGVDTVLNTAKDLVCGDVYIIQGQSNAEAWTDQRVIHPYNSPWLRSFGTPTTNKDRARDVVWGNALSFNGGENHQHLQIGYWGVELGKLLIEQHKIPICIINGAQGGTRIDQHQRNDLDPTDINTIYGRLLWRLQQAKLTHGVRAVLWHQGENDQGAAGATGAYGWVNYQDYFLSLTAAWKQDYPNINHFYIHQIWPGACGARSIENDRLREIQRRLPEQFSNLSIMSTLGIRPGGGCHYLPEGYAAMARQLLPQVNRYNYNIKSRECVTPPNITNIAFTTDAKNVIEVTFDQNVHWTDDVSQRFYFETQDSKVADVTGTGNTITLSLSNPTTATTLSYIQGGKWRMDDAIIYGENKLAALTFCEVPIRMAGSR